MGNNAGPFDGGYLIRDLADNKLLTELKSVCK